MKTKIIYKGLMILAMFASFNSCSDDDQNEPQMEAWEIEVETAKAAVQSYQDINVATNEGFFDASGYVPQMGHHYLLPSRLETGFELTKPEILLYVPDGNGGMEFVAIEYGIAVQDPENPGNPPEGFTGDNDHWHFNHELSMWQLHVWINRENPDGIFAPFNPSID